MKINVLAYTIEKTETHPNEPLAKACDKKGGSPIFGFDQTGRKQVLQPNW